VAVGKLLPVSPSSLALTEEEVKVEVPGSRWFGRLRKDGREEVILKNDSHMVLEIPTMNLSRSL